MKIYTCPKCGNKMIETAPNYCPNCGCQSREFTNVDVEEKTSTSTPSKVEGAEEAKKSEFSMLGCLGIAIMIIVVGFVIVLAVGSGSNSGRENYNDNSQPHQILAKNWFVENCVKPNMHDAKSYDEVNYTVSYDYAKQEYIIDLSFRGKNAYGAIVLSNLKGSVKFTDDGRARCHIISE